MAYGQCGKSAKQKEMNQTRKKNRLSTYRFALPGAKLGQRTSTLFLPLLLGHPHVVLVGDLLPYRLASNSRER
jgi:hypothetical protein